MAKNEHSNRFYLVFYFIATAVLGLMYAALLYAAAYWSVTANGALPRIVFLVVSVVPCMALLLFSSLRLLVIKKQKLLEQAYTDPVTGGDNFIKFKRDAEAQIQHAPHRSYVLFYSDIRNFKYINDVYGFETGNRILKRYNDLLKTEPKLAVARMSSDHFVTLEDCTGRDAAEMEEECMRRIERVSDISDIVAQMPHIIVSVGAYCTNGDNSLSVDAMIDRARLAQKQLKDRQKAGCKFYTEDMRAAMLGEQAMENRMHAALANGEFLVYLQPKFDIRTNQIAAAEALVRWNDPQQGLIPPMAFIPLFERNGFIQQLDTYMFEQVCRLIRHWLDEGLSVFPISVNVSKVQLNNPSFLSDYIRIKEQYSIPNHLLEIEFTESVLFDNSERMTEVLRCFVEHGFRSSIDDFGAGYSSLNLLKKLPADIIKLDRMFFEKEEFRDREKIILKNIIAMAKDLSMQTVAEGVEQWEQVEFLQSVECEMVQGFVFDRPQPVEQFEQKYFYNDAPHK